MPITSRTEVSRARATPLVRVRRHAPTPLDRPVLSVVIVNYRQWANTARLLRQLVRSPAARRGLAEIVVVDNHSPPHPIRRRLRRTPGVSLRCLRHNRGFARGANEGCRLSRGHWFLLLNPDVTVSPEFLESALERLHTLSADPRTGIMGLRLNDPGGSEQGSVGLDPTFLATLLGQLRPREKRKCRPRSGYGRGRVPWVTGCGLLVRRECFEQLGGFDPAYFLYYEDADLCRRARAAGWAVRHEPALALTHHHPLHGRAIPPRLRLLTRHALLTYARRHWSSWSFLALAGYIWVEAIAREWLAAKRRDARTFRTLRAAVADMLFGRIRQAYRRVRRAAQDRPRSKVGAAIEAGRTAHGRRPLPR